MPAVLAGCCALAWSLVGTLISDRAAIAIVESRDGAQQLVTTGDELDGCRIGAVERESILVDCAGAAHTVALHDAGASRATPPEPDVPQLYALPEHEFLALLGDRQRLAAQLSLEPAVAGGYVYGYRVAALDPQGALAGFGIDEGDVITDVNGAPASEPDSFIQTIDALAGQPAFSIGIERDGARLSLDYVLDSSSRLP